MNKSTDQINHPDHYTVGGIETLAILKAKLTREGYLGFIKGNIIKYITRSGHKGKELEDLKKAQFYLNALIKELEENYA